MTVTGKECNNETPKQSFAKKLTISLVSFYFIEFDTATAVIDLTCDVNCI